MLLDAGADPNAKQEGGFVAVHAAAQNGNRELAELLVQRGADTSLATDDGRTAQAIAREAGHEQLADFLA
jgi:ankyrin repeat protein